MGNQLSLVERIARIEKVFGTLDAATIGKIAEKINAAGPAVSATAETVANVSELISELREQFPNPNEAATPVLAKAARRRRRVLFTVLLDLLGAASVAYTLTSFIEISAFAFMLAGVGLALTILQLYDYVCAPEWDLYEKISENPVAVSVFFLALAVVIHGGFAAGR